MLIKGLQKTTLLDYPGKLAATTFVAGCNFRCPFCQNRDLVLPELAKKLKTYKEIEIFDFLARRKGKLEAVCITGGEPTLYKDLPEFIKKIKSMGYLVKLDTNGTNPEMVEKLIKDHLLDYVAMDYKGPMAKYKNYILPNQISLLRQGFGGQAKINPPAGGQNDILKITKKVKRTIEILLKSGIGFELRTTMVPTLHNKEDLIEMAREIENLVIENCKLKIKWYLQQFRPKNCLDPKFDRIKPYDEKWFKEILQELKKYWSKTELRGVF